MLTVLHYVFGRKNFSKLTTNTYRHFGVVQQFTFDFSFYCICFAEAFSFLLFASQNPKTVVRFYKKAILPF
jgi:hypothetical protein